MEGPGETDRGLFQALDELSRRHERSSGATGTLTRHELRCFSQNGEDGVLAEILARIGRRQRFFVEFGIESGREGNCVFLADVVDWRGAFIEPEPDMYARLAAKYEGSRLVRTLNEPVTHENVQRLFTNLDVPEDLDVLSIDVDGQDYWIWDAVTAYRPSVVVVEYNSALPVERALTQPRGAQQRWDGTSYFGSSLGALERLAAEKGYALVHTELAGVNAFFVRADLARERFPEAGEVPRRTAPNYFLRGVGHPPDPARRPYLDLDTGTMVAH